MRRGSSMVNFLWLLLVLFSCATAEEHSHRHHEATAAAATATTTTSAPGTLKQQQRLLQLQQAQESGNSNGNGNGNDIGLLDYRHQHPHHHLRHEQHLRAELAGSVGNRQPPSAAKLELEQLAMLPGPGQQHHLRHHNRHHAAWEQRVFPALRHQQQQQQQQQHRTTNAPTTYSRVVTDAPPAHSFSNSSGTRYFDRDGIYAAWMQPRATRAPNWQQLEESYEDGDEDDEYDEDEDEDYDEDADDAATAELAKQMPRYSLFSQKLPSISSNEEDYDAYDQAVDVEVDKNTNNNKHPSVANGHAKAAAKRNVFDWLFKRDKEKVKPQPQPQSPQVKPSTTEKPKSFLDDNLNDDGDDGDNDEAIDAFSNEQWNKLEHEHKIQHEHYMNKQKHQKEIEALRARNRNTPLIRRGSMRRGGGIDNEAKAAEGLLLLSDTNNNGHNANADNNYSHNYIPGKLTELKNKQLGNPKAVSNSRRGHNPDSELAEKHYRTVMEEAMCHEPQMRCMRVERDPSKIYRPHCTKLFRCSEDSGCCRSRSEICAPKEYHEVELTFYVSTVGSRKSTTEKLSFVNHTKCHCIERTNFYNGALSNVGELQQAAILNCNCPKLFEKIIQNDGKCRCDCTSSSNHCAYLKTGIEHFSMKDRKCIHQGICKAPTCQYGNYMEKHGRCPNENEQSNYNAHNLS